MGKDEGLREMLEKILKILEREKKRDSEEGTEEEVQICKLRSTSTHRNME